MRHNVKVQAPTIVIDTTRDVIETLKQSTDPQLRPCAEFFDAILTGKVTISSAAIEILDLTENRRDCLGRAAYILANTWMDIAIVGKRRSSCTPSPQQMMRPVRNFLTSNARAVAA